MKDFKVGDVVRLNARPPKTNTGTIISMAPEKLPLVTVLDLQGIERLFPIMDLILVKKRKII